MHGLLCLPASKVSARIGFRSPRAILMSRASAKRRNVDFARRSFTDIFKCRCINWLSDVQRNDAGERPVARTDRRRARDPLRRPGVDHPLAPIRGRTARTDTPRFLPCSPDGSADRPSSLRANVAAGGPGRPVAACVPGRSSNRPPLPSRRRRGAQQFPGMRIGRLPCRNRSEYVTSKISPCRITASRSHMSGC